MNKMPNYNNSIIGVSNSIIKHYCHKQNLNSCKELDQFLKRDYKHIFLVLIDALGVNILEQFSNSNEFLMNKKVGNLSTVFPPTTTAAINSLLSAKSPLESGWIAWAQYFKELDDSVIMFQNKTFYTGKKVDIVKEKYDYQSVLDTISDSGVLTESIMPSFIPNGFSSFKEQIDQAIKISQKADSTFSYLYYDKLDSKMHHYGIDSKEALEEFKLVESELERFKLAVVDDTLIIVIADHGQINGVPIELFSYPDIVSSFKTKPSLEPRVTSFHLLPECINSFPEVFNKHFGEHFKLYTKQQFIDSGLLGVGNMHPQILDCLGDYISVATGNKFFRLKEHFIGVHGGLSEMELTVPLIII